VDGQTTGYVLSLVGGMERILCDLDNNGTVTAWYVHGRDLCYRVDATNNVICYHADAMANIIALTGATGTNLAQYAYTPYGRSLASSDRCSPTSDLNPYRFVGSQGVMEELPSLYFMRARYYSAEAGVFLSTGPVKNIGSGWRPAAFYYAGGNPLGFADPKGEWVAVLFFYDSVAKPINDLLEYGEIGTERFSGKITVSKADSRRDALLDDYDIGSFLPSQQRDQLLEQSLDPAAGIAAARFGLSEVGTIAGLNYAVNAAGDLVDGKSLSQVIQNRTPGVQIVRTASLLTKIVGNTVEGSIKAAGNGLGNLLYNTFPSAFQPAPLSTLTSSVAAPKGAAITSATSTKASLATGGSGSTSSAGSGSSKSVATTTSSSGTTGSPARDAILKNSPAFNGSVAAGFAARMWNFVSGTRP